MTVSHPFLRVFTAAMLACTLPLVTTMPAVRADAPAAAPAANTAPTVLRVELLPAPELTTITDAHPRFSWVVNAPDADEVQTAYQIQVADSLAALTTGKTLVWDSGAVSGDRSVGVAYAGSALASQHEYWWRVRTTDKRNKVGAWSAPQRFRTGELVATRAIGEGVARLPLTQTAVSAQTKKTLPNGNLLIDFGRDAFAHLNIGLGPVDVETTAVLHLGEALAADGGVDRHPPGNIRYERIEIPPSLIHQDSSHVPLLLDLNGMAGSFATPIYMYRKQGNVVVPLLSRDARRMPPLIGAVMPFRYVEVEKGASEKVASAELPTQFIAHYPFDEGAARFTSSDRALNAVWDLCQYSMKATSFCGVFVDGDRERLPYEADAYLNQLGWYATTTDFAVPRYTGEHLLRNTTWPTEWFLHSVLIAWADYLYSGDDASLRLCYDELKPKALVELESPDGLISTVNPKPSTAVLAAIHAGGKPPVSDIVDWPAGERDGYQMLPVNTVVNCFHYRALTEMAQIADVTGHAADAADYRARAAKTAAAINAKLFDPNTGLYLDGEGATHSALHANLFPLAFGIIPPGRVPAVVAFVKSRGMACSVYGAQYLMDALYTAGEGDYALHLILAPGDRSWRYMATDSSSTITTEAWAQKYKPNQDWNHAWGAAPANVIPRLLMGITPTEPGFRALRIRPQPGSLTQASLDLPTIRGTIHADFTHPQASLSSGSAFTLRVRLPANTHGEVCLPRGGRTDATVTVDGKPRMGRREGAFVVIAPVGSGAHTFVR